jgi:hypothetical protein
LCGESEDELRVEKGAGEDIEVWVSGVPVDVGGWWKDGVVWTVAFPLEMSPGVGCGVGDSAWHVVHLGRDCIVGMGVRFLRTNSVVGCWSGWLGSAEKTAMCVSVNVDCGGGYLCWRGKISSVGGKLAERSGVGVQGLLRNSCQS